ncbi:hypothetical protein [Pseudomonas lini]
MKALIVLMLCCVTQVQAMSGQALVLDLNAKYASNVAQCSNGSPAYHCSGVLVRAVDYSTFFKFWDYGSAATKLGSVAFTYIRSDVGSTALNSNRKSGFILKDQTTALAEGKALNLRCIYPFPTESLDVRADHGCGFAPKLDQLNTDLANCAKLAVPATTAAAWLRNFIEHSSLPKNQCSLSTMVAGQFKASLEAHDLVDATWTAKSMEVLVEVWDESKPEKLPIEAVFYEASAPAKLADAQKFQRDYYRATSLYVPIVKLNLSVPGNNIFSFSAVDQVYGQTVAEQLNARYANVANECGGKAAYYCNGVLIRTTKASEKYHAWDPSPSAESTGGISFSYLRKDLGITRLYRGETQGFVFKDHGAAEKIGAHPIPLLCAYPVDGAIYPHRINKGCGAHSYFPDSSRSCPEENVTSVEQWVAHYHRVGGDRHWSQCSFTAEKNQFAISLEARNNFKVPEFERPHINEVVLATWPKGTSRALPLEAFIYVFSQGKAIGLEGAKFMQKDYFNTVGDIIPVIRVTLVDGAPTAFSYHEAEQSEAWKGQ